MVDNIVAGVDVSGIVAVEIEVTGFDATGIAVAETRRPGAEVKDN